MRIYVIFLVNDQRDAQILFCVFISIYNSLHVSSTQCSSSSGEKNCFNTASGKSFYVGGRDVCRLEEDCVQSSSNLHTSRPPT